MALRGKWDSLSDAKKMYFKKEVQELIQEFAVGTDLLQYEANGYRFDAGEGIWEHYGAGCVEDASEDIIEHVYALFTEAFNAEVCRQSLARDDNKTEYYTASRERLLPPEAIARMMKLERLNIPIRGILGAEWVAKAHPGALRILELEGNLDDVFVDALVGNPDFSRITRVTIGMGYDTVFPSVSRASAMKLANFFKNISNVYMRMAEIDSAFIKTLATGPAGPGLEYLILRDSPLDGESLLHLTGLPNLKCLTLINTGMTSEAMAAFEKTGAFPKLDELTLAGNPIGDTGIERLVSTPLVQRLQELDVNNTGYGAAGAKALEPLVTKGVVPESALE